MRNSQLIVILIFSLFWVFLVTFDLIPLYKSYLLLLLVELWINIYNRSKPNLKL